MKKLALALTTISLSGCYTANHAKLSEHVGQHVTSGLAISTAMANLKAEGFTCNKIAKLPSIECSRTRQGAVLYTCIERTTLAFDSNTEKVTSFEVPPIACAGL
jgi:hypothetical protein